MKSPRGIAVAVLFTLAGLAVQLFLGVDIALAVGIVAGVVAANLVQGSCAPQGDSSRDSLTSERNSSR